MGAVDIARLDPLDLDLDTADAIAAVDGASIAAAQLAIPSPTGPTRLTALQLGSDGRPSAGLWVARDDRGGVVGYAVADLPWRDNTDMALLRGAVHPAVRHHGVGRALLGRFLELADEAGRSKVYTGAWRGSDGERALPALGFTTTGQAVYAVRRVEVHGAAHGRWDRLYDEALGHARDYELVRQVGPTPDDRLAGMVALHEAINDAPADDPDIEPDVWDADRVRDYDRAMAGRRQTTYRVMARHRDTGDWAGLSLLCVDEFAPTVAHQEDTSVVRAHRGRRLGLLMKAEMLRWITEERPEVAAADTWNATTNHHMIAVNERLGARVVGHHVGFRLER